MRRRRLSSLRSRGYFVVGALVIAPLTLVFMARWFDAGDAHRMQQRVADAAAVTVDALASGAGGADRRAIEDIATRASVRIRVVDASGVVVDCDHEGAWSLRDRIGDLFFGAGGAPTLRSWDDRLPPLLVRPEIQAALAGRDGASCDVVVGATLLTCQATRHAGHRAVLVQKSAARALRALGDIRFAIIKLTFYVLLVGLVLAVWLGRRIIRPIEHLHEQIIARVKDPLSTTPVVVTSGDEVADLADAFNAVMASLVERSRANVAFAADLAHELKSPVAAIRAAAEALDATALDDARRARLSRVLDTSSRRLDELVTRFLEIARAEAGLGNESRVPVELTTLLAGIGQSLAADERYAGVRFVVNGEPLRVEGVAARLEEALRNVLDNAASFTPPGGVVRVDVRREDALAVIDISDDGPGIPPANLPRVFDRFFTDRSATAARGTGLGLALARAITEAHGGTLTAVSPTGAGAIFTFRLPLVSRPFHILSMIDSSTS